SVQQRVVASSLVLVGAKPDRCVNIRRPINLETSIEGRYLVHFLFRQEPLIRLHLILSTLNRLLTSHLAVEEVRSRIYSLEIERNLPCIRDTVLPCRKLRTLSSQHNPVVIPVYDAFPRRSWRDSL